MTPIRGHISPTIHDTREPNANDSPHEIQLAYTYDLCISGQSPPRYVDTDGCHCDQSCGTSTRPTRPSAVFPARSDTRSRGIVCYLLTRRATTPIAIIANRMPIMMKKPVLTSDVAAGMSHLQS